MAHDALAQRGPQQGESRSPLKTPCENIGPLKNAVRLRRAQESSSHDTPAATMDNERDDALIALAVLARCRGSPGAGVARPPTPVGPSPRPMRDGWLIPFPADSSELPTHVPAHLLRPVHTWLTSRMPLCEERRDYEDRP